MRARAILLLALLAACGDAPPAAPPSAVARFSPVLDAAMDWGAVPFPSDLYRDGNGAIRIGALPTPLSDAPLFAALRELLTARGGFCATCNAYFAIDGVLAPGQFPRDDLVPRAPSPDDAVLLADVDPTSPDRGRLFPLRVEWNADAGWLALRPDRGTALRRSRRYAAVLTARVRASDGSPLGAEESFVRARDGHGGDDATSARVREVVEPALAELERIGVARESVVALAAFTTADVTADVLAARAAVQGGAPLAVTIDRVLGPADLDALVGVPAEDRPGIDVPPLAGSGGTRSIVHRTLAAAVTGSFAAPRIATGAGTEIGFVRRDAAGRIAAGPREAVPFLLTIPAGAAARALPVAVAHHGFNASRTTGFATAETAARAGVALLAIDAFQHGDRAVSARDEVHAMRGGLAGADGFAETEPLDVSARVFGVLGAAPGLEAFPGYPLATLLQFGADVAAAVRVVREGGLDAAVSLGLGGAGALDPERIGFIGNSLGAVVGVSALVAEPGIRAAVQNVQPGSIVETLAESPEFRPLVEAIFLPRLGVAGPFDEVERQLLFDPIVDLSRWVLEPADPLALAPYVLAERVAEGSPEVLFQVAALDEVAAPFATASMIAASGATRVTRYDPAAHGMLEVLDQVSRLEPPVLPPFRRRAAELPIANPLVAEHLEIEEFLRRFLAPAP